jgi:imidazolonepropionase-like amidohydrolase
LFLLLKIGSSHWNFKNQGTIEVGKKANLLFLNSNPIENIEHIDEIYLVVKNGKLYKKITKAQHHI